MRDLNKSSFEVRGRARKKKESNAKHGDDFSFAAQHISHLHRSVPRATERRERGLARGPKSPIIVHPRRRSTRSERATDYHVVFGCVLLGTPTRVRWLIGTLNLMRI